MYESIDLNKLPSRFQIGDVVVLLRHRSEHFKDDRGEVIGVQFTKGKVHYEVRLLDTGREEVVDSCDVEPVPTEAA